MDEAVELLHVLGLTGTEARVYAALARHGPLSGYEVAQRAQLVRASVYPALDRLTQRGAVTALAQPRGVQYAAVPVATFADLRLRQIAEAARRLEEVLRPAEPAGLATGGRGVEGLMAAARELVVEARSGVYLAVVPERAIRLAEPVAGARERGRQVEVACMAACPQPCPVCGPEAHLLEVAPPHRGLIVCRDREEVVVAQGPDADAAFLRLRTPAVGEAVARLIEQAPPLRH